MLDQTIYLSLGGNIGDRAAMLKQAVITIAQIPNIRDFEISSFYETSPFEVGNIPQCDFLNAVCRFKTGLSAVQIWSCLQRIEQKLGKIAKPKNAPRAIDIDILFFGNERQLPNAQNNLEIPHPRWRERLFVIIPLLELTNTVTIPCDDGSGSDEIVDLVKLRESLLNGNSQYVKQFNS